MKALALLALVSTISGHPVPEGHTVPEIHPLTPALRSYFEPRIQAHEKGMDALFFGDASLPAGGIILMEDMGDYPLMAHEFTHSLQAANGYDHLSYRADQQAECVQAMLRQILGSDEYEFNPKPGACGGFLR